MNQKLSVLFPSKGRPLALARSVRSLFSTADDLDNIEVLIGLDEGDEESMIVARNLSAEFKKVSVFAMPAPKEQYELWNRLAPHATGEVFVPFSDDQVSRTMGWDTQIRKILDTYPDKIALIGLDDGAEKKAGRTITTFVLHRRVYEILGYFLPPFFSAYRTDEWMTDVFTAIDRVVRLPAVFEHMHYSLGKSPMDKTYRDMNAKIGGPDGNKEMYKKYHDLAPRRAEDVEKLKKAML